MAVARDTTEEHVKPLEGAIVKRVQIGATTEAGEFITLQSDGKWDPTNTGSAQLTLAVALKDAVDTDYIDAVLYGPVVCLTGGTIGALVYASDTAGEPSDTVGTKDLKAGFAWSETILFVDPQIIDYS